MLFDIPQKEKSIIKVLGVGGGGGNALAYMYEQGIQGVDFAICNTDNQALESNAVITKIRLGPELTDGRGAGANPEKGKLACIESIDEVRKFLADDTKMLFITAGMGGGTGTGAAPIIAKAAKDLGVLTVAIVTLPFKFEGLKRKRQALEGLEQLKKNVDSILVISNEKLKEIYGNLSVTDAFSQADNILTTAAKGIAEIITVAGKINVDFEDVNTVMRDSGVAIMGNAVVGGEDRARNAINTALNSPLLEDNEIRGAQHILLNISSSSDNEVTMDEITEITDYVQEEAGYGTDLFWGHCIDENLGEKLSITLIATGFDKGAETVIKKRKEEVIKVSLNEAPKINFADHERYQLAEEEVTAEKQVIDFNEDDVERTIQQLGYTKAYVEPPKEKTETELELEAAKQKRLEAEAARRNYLRERSTKILDNPKTINEMENQPAYLRRNVQLDDPKAAPNTLSNMSVNIEDEDMLLRSTKNRHLYDNVD